MAWLPDSSKCIRAFDMAHLQYSFSEQEVEILETWEEAERWYIAHFHSYSSLFTAYSLSD